MKIGKRLCGSISKAGILLLIGFFSTIFLVGCGGSHDSGNQSESEADSGVYLADGTYLEAGEYQIEVTLAGGSGRASIASPTSLNVASGNMTAEITWSSSNYDYMVVDDEKYLPVNEDGSSVFEIPVASLDEELSVTADTTAMSETHEIAYTLNFHGDSLKLKKAADEDVTYAASNSSSSDGSSSDSNGSETNFDITEIPELDGQTCVETVVPEYAKCFRIYRYEDGYTIIRVNDGYDYLVIPEDGKIPKGAEETYTIVQKPLNRIYVAASASMSLFDSADALDSIRLSGLQADAWYIDNAREAMENGDIIFAGKYSEPDYELLLVNDCNLAVESTMILHSPEVQEKLESLGIPVLIDRSSYEEDPLGRTEWIKLYGELTDHQEEAEQWFAKQKSCVEDLKDFENTEKTVAFFYVNDSGMVVTRKSADYIPKMIRQAGGVYIFDDLGDDSTGSSSVTMSMEEFYASAMSADYLIYNATIEDTLDSVDALLEKSPLFADFKAVKEGNVWCTGKYFYQATDVIGSMIQDIHTMLTDGEADKLSFMVKLN